MSDELLERLRRLLAPRYEVYHELGRGGMGIVYLGRHVLLDQLVAIKVLEPSLATALGIQRFLREPRMLAKLSHPNIVHVYDTSDDASELCYYIMEYLEGETLEARIARGKLPERDVAAMGRDVLAGLQFAHERGIIHRDIKPSNIFLVKGRAVLTDFGVAKSLSDAALKTAPDQRPGTLPYMPPELLSRGEATPQSDIYSLGMVLYEAATGHPWDIGMKPGDLVRARLEPWFAAALRRALEWSPQDRWPDAASFEQALWVPRPPPVPPGVLVAGVISAVAVVIWLVLRPSPPFDIAVFPWTVETQGDPSIGRTLPRMAVLPLQYFPHIKVVDPHTSFNCWDRYSRTADDGPWFENCPFRAKLYVQGRVRVAGKSLAVTLHLLDGGHVSSPQLAGIVDSQYRLADAIALELVRASDPRLDTIYREQRRWPTQPPNPQAVSEFVYGEEAFQRDDWVEAEAHYRQALALNPDFALAGWQLANVQRWRRIPVTVDLHALRAQHPDSAFPPIVRLLLDAQLAASPEERAAIYDTIVRDHPRHAYAALLYGGELHSRGAFRGIPWDSAESVFRTAVRNDPSLAPALSHLAWVRIRLGDREGARRALDELRRIARDPSGQEVNLPGLLELAYTGRFGGDAPPGPPPPPGAVAQAVRFGLTFDVPDAQRMLAGRLTGDPSLGDSVRATGHEAQALALVALGRIGEALRHFDSAAALYGSPAARFEAAEWRVLLGVLGHPGVDSTEAAQGEAALRAWLDDRALGVRAAWALGMAARERGDTLTLARALQRLRARPTGDTAAARLRRLLDAYEEARRGRPEAALRVSGPLLAFDSAGRGGDPFARAALHLGRGHWFTALDSVERAGREWLWYENADVVDWPIGSAHAGDVDWALGTYARLLLGRLGTAAGSEAKACRGVARAATLWAGADPALGAMKAEADTLAARCR